jgi:hypothetical protein
MTCKGKFARHAVAKEDTDVKSVEPRTHQLGPVASGTGCRRGRRSAAAVLTAVFLLCTSIGRAQDVTEPSLKAAFIYNFAKFTEWPQDALPSTATFSACVLGDGPIRDALERTVKGRVLAGHGVSVSQVQLDGKLRSCHLLYVSGITPAQVTAIVAAVRGAPVLTISDVDDFVRHGGIAQVFVESGKMRFDLNLEVARRSGLELSSKLLVLAAHVRDGPKGAGQ